MPVLVHLADERESAAIEKNGIKPGKGRQGIYCMPVTQSFYISHQWLRELKRRGVRSYVGVYFKLDSKTMVYAGKYHEKHKHMTLGEAIKEIARMKDPLGYELLIDRKIEPKEIESIRRLPQNMGWRYFPASHEKGLSCACPMCLPRGEIKAKRLRDKLDPPVKRPVYHELLAKILAEENHDEIETLLWSIKENRRRSDPQRLMFLLDKGSDDINRLLARTLGVFRHKQTRSCLNTLLMMPDEDTREYAASSLLELYGKEEEPGLRAMKDAAINLAIDDWMKKQ
jgi:hypothetical protein